MCEHLGLSEGCERRELMMKHIAECSDCARQYKSIVKTIDLYLHYPCPDLPHLQVEKLQTRLESLTNKSRRQNSKKKRFPRT